MRSNGNFGFEHLACEIPENRVSVEDLIAECGYDRALLERLHDGGLCRVPVAPDGPLSDLIASALGRLMEAIPDVAHRSGAVLVAHSVPIVAPADVPFLESVLDSVGFDSVPRILVSGQPCAILHMAVRLAAAWLEDLDRSDGVVIIGADRAYTALERIFFGSAMGDAAVAAFLIRDSPSHQVLSILNHTEVVAAHGELSQSEDIMRFRSSNPLLIRKIVNACLDAAGVNLDDIALLVPHTPYTLIWDTVAKLISFPRERILTDFIADTGHLNSNDSFIHYIRACAENRLKPGDLALLINPGFGGTRGCTLLRR